MKRITFLIIITLLLMSSYGCTTLCNYDRSTCCIASSAKLNNTLLDEESRGYITLDDWNYVKKANARAQAIDLVIQKDLLPYKGMFYLALEKENYQEAERIRKEWLAELYPLVAWKPKSQRGPMSYSFHRKLFSEIDRLENIVGLTDPMLMALRKDLAVAINNKDWDNAQKIQYLLSAKTNELRPSQTSGGQPGGVVVIQQPSRIQVEHVPRYGAEDVARAMSLLAGQGGHLGSEELGALRLFDILMGR